MGEGTSRPASGQLNAPVETGVYALDIARSVTGRPWRLRTADEAQALRLARACGVSDLTARLMAARGITLEAAPGWLHPRLREQLPDPSTLRDLDAAVARLVAALTGGEAITVFGDYDVDGGAASALLLRFLRAAGADPSLYIPDRLTEGYGPSPGAMCRIAATGARLVVMVDCGTAAVEALEAAHAAGLDVIVLDHHLPGAALPPAAAIVNPKREDCSSGLGDLCATAIAFMTVVGLNRALRQAGWFSASRPEPDLMALLDLVALATVCDVMPVTGLNRVFIAAGLKALERGANPGLAALARVAGIKSGFSVYHLGFLLGPRINAGGRIGACDLGARLLSGDDPDEADAIAAHLDALNRERQAIEEATLAEAEGLAARQANAPVLVVGAEGWHPGVVGLIATRLKDRYDRPAIALAFEGDQARGSGRSVSGVDLGAAVIAAREAGMLSAGGGHAMACGLSLARHRIDDLRSYLSERLGADIARAAGPKPLGIDGLISAAGATAELAAEIAQAGPFGVGNPEPVFAAPAVVPEFVSPVGESHLRVRLGGPDGSRLDAIAFRVRGTPLGDLFETAQGRALHVAGKLRLDTFRGRRAASFAIEDAALA